MTKALMVLAALAALIAISLAAVTLGGPADCRQVTYIVAVFPKTAGFDVSLLNAEGERENFDDVTTPVDRAWIHPLGCVASNNLFVSAQIDGDGLVSCSILVDGTKVDGVENSGDGAVTTCSNAGPNP